MHEIDTYHLGDKAGPPGLMRGTHPPTGVGVEILVEQDVVLPVGIKVERVVATVGGTAALGVAAEDVHDAVRVRSYAVFNLFFS